MNLTSPIVDLTWVLLGNLEKYLSGHGFLGSPDLAVDGTSSLGINYTTH